MWCSCAGGLSGEGGSYHGGPLLCGRTVFLTKGTLASSVFLMTVHQQKICHGDAQMRLRGTLGATGPCEGEKVSRASFCVSNLSSERSPFSSPEREASTGAPKGLPMSSGAARGKKSHVCLFTSSNLRPGMGFAGGVLAQGGFQERGALYHGGPLLCGRTVFPTKGTLASSAFSGLFVLRKYATGAPKGC